MPPRELTMPKLSDSMADAVIIRWLKAAGEAFARGEGLIEVETDKATVVYEAEWDGTLDAILVPEGATVAVGEPIATLANGDGGAPREAVPSPPPAEPATPPQPERAPPETPAPDRAVATPVARRTAVELGISLHGITGTGPGGRITIEDVQRAAAEGGTTPAPPAETPVSGRGEITVHEPTPTQATIARRMVESATTIPVFTVSSDVDVSQIVASRREARARGEEAPSVNDFVVKAAAATLREFPRFNASYVDGKVESYSRVNVGIAVATDDALLVPVIRDADRKSLTELAEETRALADGARTADAEARGLPRRHLHRLEPRDVRRAGVHRDHRPAAGRDPRRRQRSARAGRGSAGPRCLPRRHDRHPELRPPSRLRRGRSALPLAAARAARATSRARPLRCRPSPSAPPSATRSTRSSPPTTV
jgi:pyruvate dehydrogenase E2 component (dihydrolipoamide acetyltransferase)